MGALLFIFIIGATTALAQNPMEAPEHHCYVQSPIDLLTFNLTTIQPDDYDSTIRINAFEHLRVHFCRPLKDPCHGKHDYAVCLHSNGKEFGVGKEPPNVAIESGKIMFSYMGDKCNSTHNYTVDIEMKCHFSYKEQFGDDLDAVYNRHGCSFEIAIETIAACAERQQTKCDLSDKTGYYDLSSLMNVGSNYVIKLNNSSSVILNVCHSLLYGHHSRQCDYKTMICLVDETNTKEPRYKRLGNLNDDMRFSTNNGSVYLDLTSDTPCELVDINGFKTVKTTIEFVCQMNVTHTMPEYISGFGTCHYKFRWLTAAACSEVSLIKQSDIEHQPCTVVDPLTHLYYDLSTLSGTILAVNSTDGKAEYQFSICTPLFESNCTKLETGVCKYIKGKNIAESKGLANTKLIWIRDYIYLNYTDGNACGNHRRSSTIIIFKCNRTADTMILADHDPCAIVVVWMSPTICKYTYDIERLMENLEIDNLYQWTVLARDHENYIVQDNSTQYHLNVGIPLVEDHFTTCTNGAGVCKVVVDDEGRRISELNLGYQVPELHITENGDIYLTYLNGSICEENRSKRISTEVSFSCDIETNAVKPLYRAVVDDRRTRFEFFIRLFRFLQGTPTFKGYDDCKYYFNWRTSHACKFIDEMSMGCSIKNAFELFNFTYLVNESLFELHEDKSSGHYSARYCKDKNKCNGTFICDDWPYPEQDLRRKEYFPHPLLAFKFANESECESDTHYKAVINKWCEMWYGIAEPFLIKEEECTIGLDWDNHETTCLREENANDIENKSLNYAHRGIIVIIALAIIALIILIVILSVQVFMVAKWKKQMEILEGANKALVRYKALGDELEPTVEVQLGPEE